MHAAVEAAAHGGRRAARPSGGRGEDLAVSGALGVAGRLARHREHHRRRGGADGRRAGRGRVDVDLGLLRHDDRLRGGRARGEIRHRRGARRDRLRPAGARQARREALRRGLRALGARHGHDGADRRGLGGARRRRRAAVGGGAPRGGPARALRARRLQKAVRVTEKLVPFMAGLFLLACGAVLALRAAYIPAAVQTMVREAFSPARRGRRRGRHGDRDARRRLPRRVHKTRPGSAAARSRLRRRPAKRRRRSARSARCRCSSTRS